MSSSESEAQNKEVSESDSDTYDTFVEDKCTKSASNNMLTALSEEELLRYEAFRRAGFKKNMIKRLCFEESLKNYTEAMQKDLEKALERAELYKMFGKEKIKELEYEKDRMIEVERQKNDELCTRINELMKVIEERSADNMELIEYCRYFMSVSSK